MITVAVLIPTTGRARQAVDRIWQLLDPEQPDYVRMIVVTAVPENDAETIEALINLYANHGSRFHIVKRPGITTAVEGWNQAARFALHVGANWCVLGADDIVWHDGWLAHALQVAVRTGAEVVGLSDGGYTDINQYAPHYMASRRWIQEQQGGHMVPPIYQSWWFDREVCERARALGVYAPAPKAIAEHRHPDWKTAPMDDIYAQAWPLHDVDRAVYLQRREAGYA